MANATHSAVATGAGSPADRRPALTAQQLTSLAECLAEPPALTARRLEGLRTYQGIAWPLRQQHLWRYTDSSTILPPTPLPRAAHPRHEPSSWPVQSGPAPAGSFVQLRGNAEPTIELSEQARRAGVSLIPLPRVTSDMHWLGSAVPASHGLFEALNSAASNRGVALRIPRDTVLDQPIRIAVFADTVSSLPRLLVVAERNAQATITQEHLGGTADAVVVGVTELLAAANSKLRHVIVENWESSVRGHLTTRSVLDRDARLLTVLGSFGGRAVKMDIGARLVGRGAQSDIIGFALGRSQQHFDHHTEHHHTEHHHQAKDTRSFIDFKVALAERARSAYTGLIRIDETADQAEAFQKQRNLLLDPHGRADSIAELEISTNDVQCSHAATSAPLDAEHLFYLQSRGLSRGQARQLVVRGFFEAALRRLPEPIRSSLADEIAGALGRLQLGAEG